MASPFFDAIKATISSSTQNGPVTIGTVSSGFRAFSNIPNNTIVDYKFEDNGSFEIGIGLWNGTQITNRVLKYSSTGSMLNLSTDATVSLNISADEIQPHIGGGKWGLVTAISGDSGLSTIGMKYSFLGYFGSNSVTVNNNSYISSQHRCLLYSGQFQNTGSGISGVDCLSSLSQNSFCGGFEFVGRFGLEEFTPTKHKVYVGLTTGLVFEREPIDQDNCVLFGVSSYSTSFSLVNRSGQGPMLDPSGNNVGGGAAGTSYETPTGVIAEQGGFYECAVWCHPGERKVWWSITALHSGISNFGYMDVSTALPDSYANLVPVVAVGSGSGEFNATLAFQSLYLRSGF